MGDKRCAVGKAINQMSGSEQSALEALLDSPMSSAFIERELKAAGWTVPYQAISKHRTESCCCTSSS